MRESCEGSKTGILKSAIMYTKSSWAQSSDVALANPSAAGTHVEVALLFSRCEAQVANA